MLAITERCTAGRRAAEAGNGRANKLGSKKTPKSRAPWLAITDNARSLVFVEMPLRAGRGATGARTPAHEREEAHSIAGRVENGETKFRREMSPGWLHAPNDRLHWSTFSYAIPAQKNHAITDAPNMVVREGSDN